MDGYAWSYDLISPDRAVRAAALDRHAGLLHPGWTPYPTGTLVDPVVEFSAGDRNRAPYAVLFLRWEQDFPDDWRALWQGSPWTAKSTVLRTFAAGRVPPRVRPALLELLIGVVGRRHRCQDIAYWHLARALDAPDLRARLDAVTGVRARYLRRLLDHPQERLTSAGWRDWLRTTGRPVLEPVPATVLTALPPATAAELLAHVDAQTLATVLEGLEPIPAARILRRFDPAIQAPTVASMAALPAARLLKALPEPQAAALLAAMPPAAAGARFPGKVGQRLILRMDADTALARLSAAPPALAGRLLATIPLPRATRFLAAMDRPALAAALAAMPWPAARLVFPAMTAGDFAALLTELSTREAARMRYWYDRILATPI